MFLSLQVLTCNSLRHTSWVYALRFLRVSLSMQTGSNHDALAALQNLRSISALAESKGDIGIFITCAAFEAMAHLRISAPDSIEQAHRAIASARSYQFEVHPSSMPQVSSLLDVIDLVCILEQGNSPDQIQDKTKALSQALDHDLEKAPSMNWDENGLFMVSVIEKDSGLVDQSGGIFQRTKAGKIALTFSWLPQRDLYLVGYYLNGFTRMQVTVKDNISKANSYLQMGLKATRGKIRQLGLHYPLTNSLQNISKSQ